MTTSWYGGGGDRYAGKTTASGARLDPARLTCAHRTLPFGTRLRLTVAGHSTVVTVNDRGPWARDRKGRLTRDLDVTAAAADALGMREYGVAIVSVEII